MATGVPSYPPLTSNHAPRSSTPDLGPALDRLSRPPRPVHQLRLRRGPAPNRRRALELLASCPEGCTASLLQARGFTVEQIVALVRSGLARAQIERVVMARRTIELARIKITKEGRTACVSCTPRALQAVSDMPVRYDELGAGSAMCGLTWSKAT